MWISNDERSKRQTNVVVKIEARVTSLRLLLINKSICDCLLRPNSLSIADTCQKVDYLLGHATPSAKSLFVQNVSEANLAEGCNNNENCFH